MNPLKTAVLVTVVGASLVAGAPAFAQLTSTQGTAPVTTSKPRLDVTCGKIHDVDASTIVLQVGIDLHRIKIRDSTLFIARSVAAARNGLHVGDFGRAVGGDDRDDQSARRFQWGEVDFCKAAKPQLSRYLGKLTAIDGTPPILSLTFTDQHKNPVTVKLTTSTKFYVNGVLQTSMPTFTLGEVVRVVARENGDGSLSALRVAVHQK